MVENIFESKEQGYEYFCKMQKEYKEINFPEPIRIYGDETEPMSRERIAMLDHARFSYFCKTVDSHCAGDKRSDNDKESDMIGVVSLLLDLYKNFSGGENLAQKQFEADIKAIHKALGIEENKYAKIF